MRVRRVGGRAPLVRPPCTRAVTGGNWLFWKLTKLGVTEWFVAANIFSVPGRPAVGSSDRDSMDRTGLVLAVRANLLVELDGT